MNSITINFDGNADINENLIYSHFKKLYPDIKNVKIVKKDNEFADLLLASSSSLDFWNNDIDDEVWNNA